MPKQTDKIVRPILFQIEVPREQRKTFWTRPKGKLEYWAFKNRPRAFYNEKVIFTFDQKPVAETVILMIEGPGKGQGQYKDWHKVYWNAQHFRRYRGKSAASKWIGPVYHGTDVAFAGKPKGQAEAGGMLYFTDDPQYANEFTGGKGRYTEHSRIYPSYIRFNKPFDAREIDDLNKEGFADAIGADEDLPIVMYGDKWAPFWRWVMLNPDVTKHYLKKQGYDGIIQLEAITLDATPNTTSFITFNDNQVRSATGEKKPKSILNLQGAIKNENFGMWGVTEPDVMYHISRRANRGSIRTQGLIPQVREFKDVKRSPANYLFESPIAAKEWAFYHAQYVNQPCDIWEVTLPVDTKLFWDMHPDMGGFDAWFTTDTIPPENLKVVGTVLIPTSKSPSPEKYEGKGWKTSNKTADEVLDVGGGDEYWAGEGNAASGILPVCPQTGNVCLAMRSKHVMTPNCWGTIGGAVQEGMSPQQSAKAELAEEMGYGGGMTLIPAYVFSDRGFSYHNFIGVVSSEFSFSPKPYSKEEYAELKARLSPRQRYQLNPGWETSSIQWVPYQQWVEDMAANPGDYHPGMLKLYQASKDKIEKALKIEPQPEQQQAQPKTSADKAALTAFMQDLWSQTYGNPFNNAERVWQDKAIIEARPFDGRIHLSLIRTVEKGAGGGTEGLKFLTALADKHGVEIDLGAKPVGKGGLNKSQLVQWYKRHGFNPRRGETSDSLLYQPQERLKLSAVPVEFKEEVRGAHSGQTDMTLRALVNGQQVGYVDYSVYQDEPSVQYLEVSEKRQGYGTLLLKKLQSMFPDTEIALGMTTDDGTKLVESLKFEEKPTEYAEKIRELEQLIPERDRLQKMADDFFDQENHSDEEKKAFTAEMEKLTVIHDRIWELEQETYGKSPTKQLIAAKTSPQVIDKLVTMHDQIKDLPGRLRVSQPAVAESVAEIQQPRLEALMAAIIKSIPHVSMGHIGQAKRALENAEIAYHDYRNSTDLDTPEKIEVALNEQETALIILHQILKEEARKIGRTASFEKQALNIPRLVKDFGPKLVQRYWQHHPYPENREEMGQITPEVIINQIASQDVTPNKEYTAWITGNYARGDIARFEDIGSRVIPALKRFHALKGTRRIPNEERDIGRIKGLQQLEDLVAKYEQVDATSKRQQDVSQEQKYFTDGEAELILNDAKYKIVVPKTQEASCYFGINTRWCTAAAKGNMFQTYAKNGPLYIILVKADNARYQFHFESGQFMDERDDQIDPVGFFDEYPELARIFLPIAERVIDNGEATCESCSGRGKNSCDSCDGEGKKYCDQCGGEGSYYCNNCEGTGEVQQERDTLTDEGEESSIDNEECPACEGSGAVECTECDGAGTIRCSYCLGVGEFDCDECNGTGQNEQTVAFRDEARGVAEPEPTPLAQGATASVKTATTYYHGGGDVQGGMLDVRKGQSGAIYVTPDINYAKQYVKTNGGGLYTVDVDESKIFDPENPQHLEALEQGYLNLVGEDYDEEEAALSDYNHFVNQSPEMMMDWAVAPDAFDAIRTLGFRGMKLRERPGTVSLAEDGFNISGPPITSIALFDNKVPVTRIASDWLKSAAGFAFKSFPKLWHVGSMNAQDKQHGSYEGAGLSVSVNPEEWRQIAKKGGPLWELTKAGNKFINFHRISAAQKKAIFQWGVENEYVEPIELWRAEWYDDEAEETKFSDFKEESDARDQSDNYYPVPGGGFDMTQQLVGRTKQVHGDPMMAWDLLVTVYAEDVLECDGVWWDDTLDPANLSAPRGVIFPSKLSEWKATRVQQAKTGSADLNYYMTEGCGIFAVALCEFHPKADIKCISDPEGEAWSDDVPFEMSHVYCSTPSGNYDVNGEHSVESMASSLNMGNYRVIGGWSPKEFASKYMGMGDKPLYGDPADVEEARQIILASPEKYGVKQPKTAAAPAPGLVLQPGTKLYRGIGEDEIHNHAPASDGCLWTTESITIARTYIPASGLSLITTLEGIVQPPQERGGMEGLQKQLGFEYTDIKYEANGRPNSYRLPALMDKLVPEPHPDEKQFKTKNEYWDASHAWQDKRKKALENYVKQKLSEYGYEPEKSSFGGGRYDLMVDWQNGQNVLLPNKFQEGTVCVFEVVQPLNIYDMTEGGKVQGDLLDPQYREYGKFGTIAAAGYDGVKIEDYAQVEGHGNVGHTSIGIFKNGVPKIKEVERQTATHPEDLYADLKKYGAKQ
jgi:ADP-ribose pyrophosphatase YjhB (NUDIX family)